MRGGAGVPELRRVPGLFGTADTRPQMPMAGTEAYPFANGPFSPGWQALAQMRAAGLF